MNQDPFNPFGGYAPGQSVPMDEFLRGQAAAQMAGMANAGYEQQVWQQVYGTRSQKSDERPVTAEDERKMIIRRCGNICLEARDRGWTARFEGQRGLVHLVFQNRGGQRVVGKPATVKTAALVRAAEMLYEYGFLKET